MNRPSLSARPNADCCGIATSWPDIRDPRYRNSESGPTSSSNPGATKARTRVIVIESKEALEETRHHYKRSVAAYLKSRQKGHMATTRKFKDTSSASRYSMRQEHGEIGRTNSAISPYRRLKPTQSLRSSASFRLHTRWLLPAWWLASPKLPRRRRGARFIGTAACAGRLGSFPGIAGMPRCWCQRPLVSLSE